MNKVLPSGFAMLEIDGSYGEGGGQLVRTAVALAATTGKAINITNVRVKRDKAGLAPQHLAALRAVAQFCEAQTEGLAIGSRSITFRPQRLRGGEYQIDIGTAGSITLVLQALLPVMIAAGTPVSVSVKGGTDVRAAPPIDYFREVLLRHLARMGAAVNVCVRRRGYYPRGGGEVEVSLAQKHPLLLRALHVPAAGALRKIAGKAHVAHLPMHIPERMRSAMCAQLADIPGPAPEVDAIVLQHADAIGQGGAIVAWAETEHSVLGAAAVAERGVRAETLGETVGSELHTDVSSGAALDVHAADQILIYLALARRESCFTTRLVTLHAHTAMWLIEQFLPVRFTTTQLGNLWRITVAPR